MVAAWSSGVLPSPEPLSFKRGKGWKNIDRWAVTTTVEIARQNNLTFGDVACQVRDGVVMSSSGIERIGIWVTDPFFPTKRPRTFVEALRG